MIFSLLLGTAAGLVLSIPPGPIAIAVIRQALEGHPREGYQMAAAAAMMDVLYMLVATFTSTAIVSTLIDLVVENPWARLLFQVACIIVLVILSLKYFKSTPDAVSKSAREELEQEERAKRLGYRSPFLVGLVIAVTNLANPPFLPSLIGVSTFLHTEGWLTRSAVDNIFFSVGFGSGAGVWFMILLRVLARNRRRIPKAFTSYIFRFAAISFIVFALILLTNVAFSTPWGTLM